MKKITLLILILTLFIAGCTTGDKYDGKIVQDRNGVIYELAYSVGNTYFVHVVDTNHITDIKHFMKD